MDKTTDDRPAPPDTRALKALARPDRLGILGILRFDGPETASGLARRMGLNSGATSYHLRQLARQGYIEPAEDIGNRRDRWWRARADAVGMDPAELEGDAQEAALVMVAGLLSQHILLMQRAMARFPDQPPDWQAATDVSDNTCSMTAAEAPAFKEEVMALLWSRMQQARASGPEDAPGERKLIVMLHAFPFPGLGDDRTGRSDGA